MEQSPRLSLPYVQPAQAQKHVTVNESFRRLDALTQLTVLSQTIAAEPGAPAEGDAYILPASPTGSSWVGFTTGNIAAFQDGAWVEIAAIEGFRAWVSDVDQLAAFDGTSWAQVSGGSSETAAKFGVNTTADTTNRLSVKSDAVLFSHDDVTPGNDDCIVKVNKKAVGDTVSHLFQTGFSGRAEFGLTGDDDFHLKVSANGSTWNDALTIDKDNGFVGIGQAPSEKLHVFADIGRIQLERPSGGLIKLEATSASQYRLNAENSAGQAILDINPIPSSTDTSIIRYFRTTNTTGDVRFDIAKGNGASSINHRLRGNDDVSSANFVCNNNGKFGVGESNPGAKFHVDGGGALFGNPTGGDKGTGTINAQAVYDDNALLSCYVFDQALDGAINAAKWDSRVPDRVVAAEYDDDEDPETGELIKREITAQKLEPRQHEPMRKFSVRIGSEYDPLTLDGYAKHWREKRHLTAMPNEITFDLMKGLATGEWIQRLVETVEIQAVLIEELNQRTKSQSEDRSGEQRT